MLLPDRFLRYRPGKSSGHVDRVLRCLVRSAYRNVPFYRRAWDAASVDPQAVKRRDDLGLLPITTRNALAGVAEGERLHQKVSVESCFHTSTSGYLGVPLTVHMSRVEALWRKVMLLRAFGQYGALRWPLRLADVGPMVPTRGQGLEQRLKLVQVLRLPATLSPAELARRLQRFRPHLVEGYPTCLEVLAEELAGPGKSYTQPRLVVSRGEVLHSGTRELLSQVFACRVADLYSCEEGGNLAWECPEQTGLWHVNTDTCVLEVVDDAGAPVEPGVRGRLLLTNLFNLTMPFIRCELGDLGTLGREGTCACGAQGPTLTSIEGRDDDLLTTPGGERLSPRLVANTVFNSLRKEGEPHAVTGNVRQFQIAQRSRCELALRVVLANPDDLTEANQAARALEHVLSGMTCRVEPVSELPRAPGGKLKKVVVERSD